MKVLVVLQFQTHSPIKNLVHVFCANVKLGDDEEKLLHKPHKVCELVFQKYFRHCYLPTLSIFQRSGEETSPLWLDEQKLGVV